jgi:hypothetical protein
VVRVAVAAALAAALAAPARAAESRSLGENFGLGLVAGFGTMVYFPVKMVYSMIGGLVGGLTYLVTLANEDTANAVWQPTLGGSYVLTPDMIAGQEPVEFIGSEPRAQGKSSGQWPE